MSIIVRDLCKNFGPLRAVDRVSFEIPRGGIVGLIGPNGAGKSTILRILTTFLQSSSGQVVVAGFDLAQNPAGARQQLGYLPENPPGSTEARVDEYLTYRAQLKGIGRRDRSQEIDRCLEACELTTVRRRLIGRLSQGFRRRVGLADAMLARPSVLILDEPTIGLDPLQVRHTRELFAELARESTILLSTHLLTEAEELCQRVLMLMHGRLVADIAMAELNAATDFEIELDGPPAECESMLLTLSEVTKVGVIASTGCWHVFAVSGAGPNTRQEAARESLRRGWNLRELRAVSGTLEDHFARLAVRVQREAA